MNEEYGKEMEKEENEKTLLELVSEVAWVFGHPFLREWVKEAPSIKSIDNFIYYQFADFEYRMELIKLMRKAVKAWKMISNEDRKKYLETPKGWRLSDMFIFDFVTDLPGRFEKSLLNFATGIKFLPDPKKAFNCANWPLLLREFCSDKDSDMITSVDCWNSRISNIGDFFAPREVGEEFWQGNKAEAHKGNPKDFNEMGYNLSFVEEKTSGDRPIACVNILFKHFGICTRIVRIKPEKEGQYSRFYKTVCIRDKCYGNLTQVIKIWQPIDCVSFDKRGRVVYSRRVKLHQHLVMNLQMEYSFGKEFKLLVFPEHNIYDPQSFIRLDASGCQHSLLFQECQPAPAPEKVIEAMFTLYPHFLNIWEHSVQSSKVSLESILGQEMIKDPPNSLLRFFNGER